MKKGILFAAISLTILAVVVVALVGFLPRGAAAQTTSPVNISLNSQQGIWVNGQGTVTVVPDIAIVNLGVSAQASTVADALALSSGAMDKISAALVSQGVDKKDIQTNYFNIQQIINNNLKGIIVPNPAPAPFPLPAPDANSAQGSSGAVMMPVIPPTTTANAFQVDNSVAVKIRATDKVGIIIDAVAAAGGDLTRVNGVSFTVEKPDQYYAQARRAAMSDAQAKAQQLAQLSGVALGKAFYISENSNSQPVYYPSARYYSEASGSGGTSLSPGQTDIILSVQVAYSIQ